MNSADSISFTQYCMTNYYNLIILAFIVKMQFDFTEHFKFPNWIFLNALEYRTEFL